MVGGDVQYGFCTLYRRKRETESVVQNGQDGLLLLLLRTADTALTETISVLSNGNRFLI